MPQFARLWEDLVAPLCPWSDIWPTDMLRYDDNLPPMHGFTMDPIRVTWGEPLHWLTFSWQESICTSLDSIVNCDLMPAARPAWLKASNSEGRSQDTNYLEYLLCLFTIHVRRKSHELPSWFQFWVEVWAGHKPNSTTVSACLSGDMGCNDR